MHYDIVAPRALRALCATAASTALALLTQAAAAQEAPSAVSSGPPKAEAPLVPASTVAATNARPPDDVTELREEVRALRAEVEAAKAAPPPASTTPAAAPRTKPLGYEDYWPWVLPPEGVSVSAYMQTQYETHQDAQDQLSPTGATLNKDRFSVRRARATLNGEWEYTAFALQIDANTTNGPQVDLRKAEASLQYRPDRAKPPIVMATMGLFDIPFGFDNVEPEHTRFFMEPTTVTSALFPGKADLGLRLAGALGAFRWVIAIQNGEPLGEASAYVEQDPNSAKDVVARFGFDTPVRRNVQVAAGVSGLTGEGFSPGILPSGATLQWRDTNGDGVVQSTELLGTPAQSGQPSQNFNRWAVGGDIRTNIRWWPGVAKLSAEIVLAQNLDRGLFVANPVLTGIDQREFGASVAAQQEILRYGIVGVRFDYYNPNSNLFDSRNGSLIPYSEAIQTLSPLVGLVLPDRARLLFQYDIISNSYARNTLGVPTNLADNVMTLRLQVQL